MYKYNDDDGGILGNIALNCKVVASFISLLIYLNFVGYSHFCHGLMDNSVSFFPNSGHFYKENFFKK